MTELLTRSATAADAPAIHRLLANPQVSLDSVLSDLARPAIDLGRDTLLLHRPDGELVAWAWVHQGRRAEAHVHPGHRGQGLGTRLLAWTETNARNAASTRLGQNVDNANPSAAQLLTAHGYELAATQWLLHLALPQEPAVPAPPPGVTLRAYRPEDAAGVHRLVEDAFGEFRSRRRDLREWAQHTIERPTFAPAQSPLAFDGDSLVGALLCLDHPDSDDGYIAELAVDAGHRRRGLARLLMRQAFREHFRHGRRGVRVWTHSETGALPLYESLGMRVISIGSHYTKAL